MTTDTATPDKGNEQVNPAKSPDESGEQSPKSQEPTITQAELNRAIQEAKTQAGRDGKAAAEKYLSEQLTELQATQEKWHKEREEAELKAVENDPAKVNAIKLRQDADRRLREAKDQEAKNKAERALLDAEKEASEKTKLEVDIFTVAKEMKVDPVKLKAKLNELGITDKTRFKAVAKMMKTAGSDDTDSDDVDSGKHSGIVGRTDEQKLKSRYPTMK